MNKRIKEIILVATAAALVVAAVACGGGGGDDGYDAPTPAGVRPGSDGSQPTPGVAATQAASGDEPTSTAAGATQTTTAGTLSSPGGAKTYSAEPPLTIDQNKQYFATIKTDVGDMVVELFPKDAPHHVNSFVFLAREGFYDGVTFHRVIPGFVAQAGDPTGTGRGGPGYTIPDEVNSRKFLDGTLGMAKTSAPNSAGSQWFIDYAPQPSLDGGYTVFGQLVEGRDVLDKIAPRNPATAREPGTRIITIEIEER